MGLFSTIFGNKKSGDCCNVEIVEVKKEVESANCGCSNDTKKAEETKK